MKFTNVFLFLLAGTILLLSSCEVNDRNSFEGDCLEPDDVQNCQPLSALNRTDHFDALLGCWTLISSKCGDCFFEDECQGGCPYQFAVVLSPDSTYSVLNAGEVKTGVWFVDTVTRGGQLRTQFFTMDTNWLPIPDNICDNDLGSSIDRRPVDGTFEVFRRD